MPLNSVMHRRDILRILAGGRFWRPASGQRCRRGAHRQADRRSARARADVTAHRFHFRRAARHALSRLHADRRAAPAGTIRAARRRLRLRDVLRDGAGGGAVARHGRVRGHLAGNPLPARHRELVRAQSLFLRMEPAQHREQDLPRGRHGRRGGASKRRSIGTTRSAGGASPCGSSRAPCSWPTRRCCEAGDIVGFVTRRPNLDYFHIGFIAFGADGELLLRHAAESRHRVLDERMERFVAHNRVRYVTLLRPEEPAAAVARARL